MSEGATWPQGSHTLFHFPGQMQPEGFGFLLQVMLTTINQKRWALTLTFMNYFDYLSSSVVPDTTTCT